MFDLVVIGGGIVGLAVAMEALERFPNMSVLLIEKEAQLAAHQTGRNSGVVHAGVYYQPGSMKARFCKEGASATAEFCRGNNIAFEQCGKMLVATTPIELERMTALQSRCEANGLQTERLDRAELTRREPNIEGLGAVFVPATGIVDYGLVAAKMAEKILGAGAEIALGHDVKVIREEGALITVEADRMSIQTRNLIVCAGLHADRMAMAANLEPDFRIIPFRGEYFRLPDAKNNIVRHLIYPIPDPALPFLGVHLTKMIGGYVTVGPNAVLAFAKEGYRLYDVEWPELLGMIGYSGFRKLVRANLKFGLGEIRNSLFKRSYLSLCQRYCPQLRIDDLLRYRAGVRAQAVLKDGTFVHDFLIKSTRRSLHVCNAPSPAATSAIPIARELLSRATERFGW
ncbi:L-2-hydroxyglutarate oxidase [Rhizobium sp. BR 362]|uniref:L-2-hydroxyglutarate oxidase n=1 Tax=Rhizobium sp. BR 362 TaxID=3040670 RepID=UPI002F416252